MRSTAESTKINKSNVTFSSLQNAPALHTLDANIPHIATDIRFMSVSSNVHKLSRMSSQHRKWSNSCENRCDRAKIPLFLIYVNTELLRHLEALDRYITSKGNSFESKKAISSQKVLFVGQLLNNRRIRKFANLSVVGEIGKSFESGVDNDC